MYRVINSMSGLVPKHTDQRSKDAQGPGPFRTRSELAQEERAQRKQLELVEQHSELNPPNVRIRAWEKVHGLRLPLDSGHPILTVIAVGTRLTLAEVQAEQRARASTAIPFAR